MSFISKSFGKYHSSVSLSFPILIFGRHKPTYLFGDDCKVLNIELPTQFMLINDTNQFIIKISILGFGIKFHLREKDIYEEE